MTRPDERCPRCGSHGHTLVSCLHSQYTSKLHDTDQRSTPDAAQELMERPDAIIEIDEDGKVSVPSPTPDERCDKCGKSKAAPNESRWGFLKCNSKFHYTDQRVTPDTGLRQAVDKALKLPGYEAKLSLRKAIAMSDMPDTTLDRHGLCECPIHHGRVIHEYDCSKYRALEKGGDDGE